MEDRAVVLMNQPAALPFPLAVSRPSPFLSRAGAARVRRPHGGTVLSRLSRFSFPGKGDEIGIAVFSFLFLQ